jgi:aspartyl protease family protein
MRRCLSALPLGVLSGALCLAPGFSHATTVYVMSLANGRADLIVNGSTVRQLREGQTSSEGVTLMKSDGRAATFQYDGRTYTFGIGQGNAPGAVLQADPRGHFIGTIFLNGVPTRALVDTGATDIAISVAEAQRLGFNYLQGARSVGNTANGTVATYNILFSSVQVGDIVVRNVQGSVLEGNGLGMVLLGMSFLNQVEMRRSGSTLTLTRRY